MRAFILAAPLAASLASGAAQAGGYVCETGGVQLGAKQRGGGAAHVLTGASAVCWAYGAPVTVRGVNGTRTVIRYGTVCR